MTTLTGRQIAEQAPDGWVYLLDGLQTRIRTGDFATGISVVNAIGAAAQTLEHYPDIELRPSHVDVRVPSHDVRRVTDRDIAVAHAISAAVTDVGVKLEGSSVSRLELALDTPEMMSVIPFWRAVLAMESSGAVGDDDALRDPFASLPDVWFQQSGRAEPRQRWHLDVSVDPGQVQPRIDAALAAGGTLVDAGQAPSYWVLADPDGNRVCLCTWQGRD